jgi:hypothetical protein
MSERDSYFDQLMATPSPYDDLRARMRLLGDPTLH